MKSLDSVVITSLLSAIIIMTWLYYCNQKIQNMQIDTKDTVFV